MSLASLRWRQVFRNRETQRTSWSAAGCNKPANDSVEQAVEVVRNHEDGTCHPLGSGRPKEDLSSGSGHAVANDGGEKPLDEPHERTNCENSSSVESAL
jgi:hypothetical protein